MSVEHEIAGEERLLREAEAELASLDRHGRDPTGQLTARMQDIRGRIAKHQDKIGRLRADQAEQTKREAEAALRRTLEANERMADAAVESAKASADAARWTKWAAFAAVAAAFASVAGVVIQLLRP